MTTPMCIFCKYYQELTYVDGKCRRYPPTVTFNDNGEPNMHSPCFPRVPGDEWCGEYKEKEKPS